MKFNGFCDQTFAFLLDIALNNSVEYYTQNKQRYEKYVKQPMLELNFELANTIQSIDCELVTTQAALSRLRRDTRYVKDNAPYHDYSWLMYRKKGTPKSSYFGLFFTITPVSYSIGCGCYAPEKGFMEDFRKRVSAQQAQFLHIISNKELKRFKLTGDEYKISPKYSLPEFASYTNKKFFYLQKSVQDIKKSFSPDLLQEVEQDLLALQGIYKFMNGK